MFSYNILIFGVVFLWETKIYLYVWENETLIDYD